MNQQVAGTPAADGRPEVQAGVETAAYQPSAPRRRGIDDGVGRRSAPDASCTAAFARAGSGGGLGGGRCPAAGQPTLALIEGEAGIGKTRLLEAALKKAPGRGMQVARRRAEELEQTRPFGPAAGPV
jgi:hypothetical protein